MSLVVAMDVREHTVVLASEIDTEPHWAILFADNLVMCETSKAAVERNIEMEREREREIERERQGEIERNRERGRERARERGRERGR